LVHWKKLTVVLEAGAEAADLDPKKPNSPPVVGALSAFGCGVAGFATTGAGLETTGAGFATTG